MGDTQKGPVKWHERMSQNNSLISARAKKINRNIALERSSAKPPGLKPDLMIQQASPLTFFNNKDKAILGTIRQVPYVRNNNN